MSDVYINNKELNDAKQKLNEFQNLAKRIVQTDLILRKYSEKDRECETQKSQLKSKEKYNLK